MNSFRHMRGTAALAVIGISILALAPVEASAKTCKSVFTEVVPAGPTFHTKNQAIADARFRWRGKVIGTYGNKWSVWAIAANTSHSVSPGAGNTWRGSARARPCRL
jgi:hypothetical protein